ncbi:MAG: B12-binding domain-containing protein [Planctomycetota bacterium]|nr:B12-binding domain-containing protein [Planctomycetota bacterium]
MVTDQYIRPRQLAEAIGVSESTLKRWTDRGLLPSVKTVGGHRRLPLWGIIAFLRKTGQPLIQPELVGFSAPVLAPDGRSLAGSLPFFVDLLLGGHVMEAKELTLRAYLRGHSLCDICDDLFRPAMQTIGSRWASGECDVYKEHCATQTMCRVIGRLRTSLRPPAEHDPLALGAAPQGDPYGLSTLMAELVLLGRGWQAVNLGPNTPLRSLARAVIDMRPRLIWLSVSAEPDTGAFVSEYEALREAAQETRTPIAIGGRGINDELRQALTYSTYGERLKHLGAFVDTLSPRNLPAPVGVLLSPSKSDPEKIH